MHFMLLNAATAVLGVTVSNTAPYAENSGPTAGTITTDPVAATASGGTPGYTYSWTKTGGSAKIAALNPTSSATAFQATGMIGGETAVATFTCTVTDSAAATVTSGVVTVTIQRGTGGGGGA
jgi:hypothetical protein